MDVLCSIVAPGLAAVCTEVVSAGLLRWLEASGVAVVDVPADDAMHLGVNVLALGDDRVVSAVDSGELNAKLRSHGLDVLDPHLRSFTRGGGGAHCLTQAIRRV